MSEGKGPRPYSDPYLAGVGLGLVLLAAYLVAGRGLGASGAFGAVVSGTVGTVAPAHAEANDVYRGFLAGEGGVLGDWLVVEIVGVLIGGLASAALAGRFRMTVERPRGVTVGSRVRAALGGGLLMGLGAALARGCTSGQALSGGALMSVGSWVFIGTAFAGGYLAAPFFRKLWTPKLDAGRSPGSDEGPSRARTGRLAVGGGEA